MNESRISVRYSKALFQSALEKKLLGRVNQDMIQIKEMCSLPEIKELLTSPIIIPSKKTEVLHKIFGADLHKLTLSLVDLIVKNGRESYLPAIARVFVHNTLIHDGITETILTTAVKVDAHVKKQISELVADLFKTKVVLKEIVDESIIGGFVLKIGDNFFDASVWNKLRKIQKELKASSIRI
jgi:F-type H+-transporting ATPase subunit delta